VAKTISEKGWRRDYKTWKVSESISETKEEKVITDAKKRGK
jgi:hypothetical protein